ncbi:TetR/AcrR family transcriptional regulator [Microlunatus elymi]|uniref:TetR/AcrR family transcriptional regulator n=1 Tax=Microlunatus elymi TaxID=2596828 RepID=A0A516PU07_9ACTN|nr:TetR/AcrR family transcriptional regulator [Microlunatus elymi]QDP94629.1 TetR/AcrR family transcriptional regulator [Microlunatus elymi]
MDRTAKLTPKGEATRRRIIAGAAQQLRDFGVADTTLDDVRARTSTSKSQLFHYFPGGREELLLAVARYEAERVLTDQDPYLSELTSWAAWGRWRDAVIARYRAQGPNCPLAALMSQVRQTQGAGEVTTVLLAQWADKLAAGVVAMQRLGKVRTGLDPRRTAQAIVALIQGGVAVLMATGRIDHLEAAMDLALNYLRSQAPGSRR